MVIDRKGVLVCLLFLLATFIVIDIGYYFHLRSKYPVMSDEQIAIEKRKLEDSPEDGWRARHRSPRALMLRNRRNEKIMRDRLLAVLRLEGGVLLVAGLVGGALILRKGRIAGKKGL
jgi:hypothetical protein